MSLNFYLLLAVNSVVRVEELKAREIYNSSPVDYICMEKQTTRKSQTQNGNSLGSYEHVSLSCHGLKMNTLGAGTSQHDPLHPVCFTEGIDISWPSNTAVVPVPWRSNFLFLLLQFFKNNTFPK